MNKVKIITSDLIKYPHGFSTRVGGVSTGAYESLNLGIKRGDSKENVVTNWNIFLEAMNMPHEFVCGNQVHGNRVVVVDEKDVRIAYGEGNVYEADGFVTNRKNVPLAIFTADCVPVLLEDTVNEVIGAVHCGWRSTVADIEGAVVEKMISLGAEVQNIHVAIGPAICEKCFEVGAEVIEAVNHLIGSNDFYVPEEGKEGKFFLDLRQVVRERAIQLGVNAENIWVNDNCTLCEPSLFWSHRYNGTVRGSQASVICMK